MLYCLPLTHESKWKMKNETLYILYYFKKKSLGNNIHMINSRTILQNLIGEKKYWY